MSWIASSTHRQHSCLRLLLLIISLFLPVLAIAQVPTDPSNLVANPYSPGRINVYWYDNSNNETSFVLERKRPSTDWAVVATLPTNTWQYIDNNVSPTNGYYYRVKAVNASGESAWSNTASAVTPAATTLTVPASPLAKCIAYSKNQLTWTDTNTSEDGYRIERKIDGGSWNLIANTLPNVVTYKDENLTADTNYSYRVRAYNVYYTSTWTGDLNSPTWKPYLSALTSPTDVISAAGTTQMRVERTASSPSPLTVTLSTNISGASVPSTVTIPANARSVSFNFTMTGSPDEADLAAVTAIAEGWAEKLDLRVRRSTSSLAPSNLVVTPGNGANWLSWNNPVNAIGKTYTGIQVSRRVAGGGWTAITSPMRLAQYYVDIVPSINLFEYRIDLIDKNGAVVASSNIANGTPTSGTASITLSGVPMSAESSFNFTILGANQGELDIYIDGQHAGTNSKRQSSQSFTTQTGYVNVSDLSPGAHSLQVATRAANNGGWSNAVPFVVASSGSRTVSDGVVAPDLGLFCRVTQTLPSTTLNWTAKVTSHAGTVVRTWSGNGNNVNIVWDGKTSSGDNAPIDRYYMQIIDEGQQVGYCDIVLVAKDPRFLSVIMLPADGGLGYNVCAGLADRIVENLTDRYYTTFPTPEWTIPVAVLIYTDKTRMSPLMFSYIKHALKSATHVHIDGHGWSDQVELGNERYLWPGYGPSDDNNIHLGQVVADRQFAFQFLWLDSCGSFGITSEEQNSPAFGPFGGMTDVEDLDFYYSSGVNLSLGSRGFMGWNGLTLFNFIPGGTENVWGRYRRLFFKYFISYGWSMQESSYNAMDDAGRDLQDSPYYPWTTTTINGNLKFKMNPYGNVWMP